MTVADKELSQSKHTSVKELCCRSAKQPRHPTPHSRPRFRNALWDDKQTSPGGGGGACPAFSLHHRDVSFSRPAEAQELIHREGESAHFKKKERKRREKREIRRVNVSTSVRRGGVSRLCAKQHNSSGAAVVCCSRSRRVLAYETESVRTVNVR